LFLCDDNIIIDEPIKLDIMLSILDTDKMLSCISLRMHSGINYCYLQNCKVKKPSIKHTDFGIIWNWQEAENQHNSWGYPMSINTHIYRTDDIRPLINSGSFKNVNELEAHLNRNRFQNKPYMISHDFPVIFDCCNNDVKNGDNTAKEFNDKFIKGYYIDSIHNIPDNCCHGVIDYTWSKE
jgi:hypothetical protein